MTVSMEARGSGFLNFKTVRYFWRNLYKDKCS